MYILIIEHLQLLIEKKRKAFHQSKMLSNDTPKTSTILLTLDILG